MYKLNIEELNIQGEPEVVKTCYFNDCKAMFEYAFTVKRDHNKIFIDEHEILYDWKQGDPIINSAHYRIFVLTHGLECNATDIIKMSALFMHGDRNLVISYGRQLLETLKGFERAVINLQEAIEEYNNLKGVNTNE